MLAIIFAMPAVADVAPSNPSECFTAQTVNGEILMNGNCTGDVNGKAAVFITQGDTEVPVTLQSGSITQKGTGEAAFYLRSQGNNGSHGENASFTNTSSSSGGNGTQGGDLSLTNNGAIKSNADNAEGMEAFSSGGNGGDGGSGWGLYGPSAGGNGGNGGIVDVVNNGSISTSGYNSAGIVGHSEGGTGGRGGDSGWISGGGTGGRGGNSGNEVDVTNNGTITTTGGRSAGIVGQSIGGGGGNGGPAQNLFFALGAQGGPGGVGRTVDIQNSGSIVTEGGGSNAITAISVGGGGGHGGSAIDLSAFAGVAIGGSGGGGGNSGDVIVNHTGETISTSGISSKGILAQAIGGGGGDGGNAKGLTVGAQVAFQFSFGGNGAGAGNGDAVTVRTAKGSSITTGIDANTLPKDPGTDPLPGDFSTGILAQSIGGGGGTGGSSTSIALSAGDDVAISAAVGLGGKGGGGGDAGYVLTQVDGNVNTQGRMADAVIAQSIGGGGGAGGSSTNIAAAVSNGVAGSISVGIGGSGGPGGNAGITVANASGKISTYSTLSRGLVAQSIGGGGGSGGHILNVDASAGENAGAVSVGVGGSGSAGGDGNYAGAFLGDAGSILTFGHQSHGLVAQSIGGGGGSGGSVDSYALSASQDGSSATVGIGVGGSGSKGGRGAFAVAGINRGNTIATEGDSSYGALVQSIGGGGGDGGHVFELSIAASLDSIEEGGTQGNRASSVAVSVGGAGGAGGDGTNATFVFGDSGSIKTEGTRSTGVVAQSIGGGGGSGGSTHSFAVSSAVPLSVDRAAKSKLPALVGKVSGVDKKAKGGLTATVAIGGSGGAAGNGGEVFLVPAQNMEITTAGNQSYGILAQSVGGGGGSGGHAFSDNLVGFDETSLSFDLGGKGGKGGDGGEVTMSILGNPAAGPGENPNFDVLMKVRTEGTHAHGILAQSIGGGGGESGAAVAGSISEIPDEISTSTGLALGADGGTGGKGGDVRIEYIGELETTGDGASGIIAQSIGGGGGAVGTVTKGTAEKIVMSLGILSADTGALRGSGEVTIDTSKSARFADDGLIKTSGDLSHGLVVQAVNAGGGMISLAGDEPADAEGTFPPLEILFGHQGFTTTGMDAKSSIIASGRIMTSGDVAIGALVQSIGAGGGIINADGVNAFSADNKVKVTGTGSAVSTSATVNFSDTDAKRTSILTTGRGSHGVVMQGMLGYGGALFADQEITSDMLDMSGATTTTLSDSTVTANLDLNGTILTRGENSHGAIIQVGNSGLTAFGTNGVTTETFLGAVGQADAEVNVTVHKEAQIRAFGDGSDGLRIQNLNRSGTFDANVNLLSSVTSFGRDTWALSIDSRSSDYNADVTLGAGGAIFAFADGGTGGGLKFTGNLAEPTDKPSVTVGGFITARGLTAISMPKHSLTDTTIHVTSEGRVEGDIVNSEPQRGMLTLRNEGNIIGGTYGVDYYLTGTHQLSVNLDGSGDILNQTRMEDSAAGRVNVNVASLALGSTGAIVQVNRGDTAFSDVVWTDSDAPFWVSGYSGLANYSFQAGNGGDYGYRLSNVGLGAPAGLTGNDASLALFAIDHITSISEAQNAQVAATSSDMAARQATVLAVDDENEGGAALGSALLSAMNAGSQAEFAEVMDIFDASEHFISAELAMSSANFHLDQMQNCGGSDGNYSLSSLTECNWGRVSYQRTSERDGSGVNEMVQLGFGRQYALDNGLYAGLSAAFEDGSFRSEYGMSDSKKYHVGAMLKAADGPLYGFASLTANYGTSDMSRNLTINGSSLTATSKNDTSSLVGRIHAGYVFDAGKMDITPMAELSLGIVRDSGYREKGAGAFNYQVQGDTHMLADTRFSVRFSGDQMAFGKGMLQAYVEPGLDIALNSPKITASLPDSLGAEHTVELTGYRDKVIKTLSAGLAYDWDDTYEVKMNYDLEAGRKNISHGIGVNFSMKF
jgi:hypothetical protein